MAKPIQAGSLASVVELAENPPDWPIHSVTGYLQQPLVLYIARVPGSHGICLSSPHSKHKKLTEVLDVFLTTMKPQQKVVTAQDVQSSLYYMHVDRPEDYELLNSFEDPNQSLDDEDSHGKPSIRIGTGSVRRTPLPASPMLGSGDLPEPPPEVNPYFQAYSNGVTSNSQAEGKPFSQHNMAEHRRRDESLPLPHSNLLGPRPMNQSFLSVDYLPPEDVPKKKNFNLRRWPKQPASIPPNLPPRSFSGRRDSVPIVPPRPLGASSDDYRVANRDCSRLLHRQSVTQSTSLDITRETKEGPYVKGVENTSLSLIRRYNNEQWTVGRISSKGTKPPVSGLGESSHGISIHIMTHGYSKFIDSINSFAEQAGTFTEKSDSNRDIQNPITAAVDQFCFQRHLQVSGYAMSRKQRHRPETTDSTFLYQGTRTSFDSSRHRHQSSDSTGSNRSFTNELPELKSAVKRGCILRSPWDGICEFTTGVAGRSFKCKHSYASSTPGFGLGMHSAQVSELRFNLPSSKTVGSPAPKSVIRERTREDKGSSLFLHRHGWRSSSSFEAKDRHRSGYFAPKVELEERLDLSLGQEWAGGGFGGKQAKLGKLIIENEGLQMLDLIVAANMALWWRVYERIR